MKIQKIIRLLISEVSSANIKLVFETAENPSKQNNYGSNIGF
jgi:hypothetical protein